MNIKRIISIVFLVLLGALAVNAQPSEFTYQGNLKDGANPANGNYDFEFKLYDAASNGTLLGTKTRSAVAVANGVFSVKLDFAPTLFPGTARFLEIGIKPAGSGGGYQQLLPRSSVDSSPYAYQSLNATNATNSQQLGGIAANQYLTAAGGNSSYIQNTTSPQASSNFNISGTGSAATFNVTNQYNLGGLRILYGSSLLTAVGHGTGPNNTGAGNSFVGASAGAANTTGFNNSFFGNNAGQSNTVGDNNAFFGVLAGSANTTGQRNSFFGGGAGLGNTTGSDNSFFGNASGSNNATGSNNSYFGAKTGSAVSTLYTNNNSFFGASAGLVNVGNSNSFFGAFSGYVNSSGDENAFFGYNAGHSNISGGHNSFFGANAGYQSTGSENSFFGTRAGVSNTTGLGNSFFGEGSGYANTTANANTFVGNAAGNATTTGSGNTFIGQATGLVNTIGHHNTLIGTGSHVGANDLEYATGVGAGTVVDNSNTIKLGRDNGSDTVVIPGKLEINTLGSAGSTHLCLNGSSRIGPCSSLAPAGEVEQLQTKIVELQRQIDALRNLLCTTNQTADLCRAKEPAGGSPK